MKQKRGVRIFLLIVLLLLLGIFFIRLFSAKHLDDLHPGIPCEESLVKKSDYLAVIPDYLNDSIANHPEWCSYVKSFNKILILHGVRHSYDEFEILRNESYIQEGIDEFSKCFGFEPTEFKAPQLHLSKENSKVLKEKFNFKIHTKFSQLFHKVYHCNDSGSFSNLLQGWIYSKPKT